jgi:threonine dehydratase
LITLLDIQEARKRIHGRIRRTPATSSESLGKRLDCRVSLKLELFQKTGSFKVRGAFNKVLAAGADGCGEGLVAVSGGNHAQAVAYVARELGLRAKIIMPSSTPSNYVDGTRGYGADIVFAADATAAFATVAGYEKQGWLAVHPFDDPLVIAGQGTTGLEIVEDLPDLTDLVVSIGGGGFIGGVATAVKALKPEVRIWGVETEGADAMAQALAAGHPVQLPGITSIARTLGAPSVSERTLAMARRYLESVTVVPDSEAVESLRVILERAKVLTEPAGACTLAAAGRLKGQFQPSSHVVLLLCGGNVGLTDVCRWLEPVNITR